MWHLFHRFHHVDIDIWVVPVCGLVAHRGHEAAVGFCYATDEHQAVARVRAQMGRDGREFVDLLERVHAMPPAHWADYVRHGWSGIEHRLPDADAVREPAALRRVWFTPWMPFVP